MGLYQPFLCGINLVMLCSSTALLYFGSILINFYLLPYLDLYSSNFSTVPYLVISIGVFLLLSSIFGFVAAGSKSRIILAIYAGVMGVIFILQLTSIFTSIDFRNELVLEDILTYHNSDMEDEMAHYWSDPDVKAKWDTLQRDFQCCGSGGGQGWHTGYKDWQRVAVNELGTWSRDWGIPLSCCLDEQPGCAGEGKDIFQELRPERKVYTHGCMTILAKRLERDVQPLLLTYIGCAVVLALLEILSLVLASAYVAAISRKSKREGGDRLGLYERPQHQPSVGTKMETLYARTLDSGIVPSATGSLKSANSYRLESAPPRTPSGSMHRSSAYIEPSTEAGTVI